MHAGQNDHAIFICNLLLLVSVFCDVLNVCFPQINVNFNVYVHLYT